MITADRLHRVSVGVNDEECNPNRGLYQSVTYQRRLRSDRAHSQSRTDSARADLMTTAAVNGFQVWLRRSLGLGAGSELRSPMAVASWVVVTSTLNLSALFPVVWFAAG
jgi:hypothetical protein